MAIRGVAWPLRKAVKIAPALTLTILHDTATSPQTIAIGIPGIGPMKPSIEVEKLDFIWEKRKSPMMGTIKTRAHVTLWEDIKDEI